MDYLSSYSHFTFLFFWQKYLKTQCLCIIATFKFVYPLIDFLSVEPTELYMLSEHSTSELHCQPHLANFNVLLSITSVRSSVEQYLLQFLFVPSTSLKPCSSHWEVKECFVSCREEDVDPVFFCQYILNLLRVYLSCPYWLTLGSHAKYKPSA